MAKQTTDSRPPGNHAPHDLRAEHEQTGAKVNPALVSDPVAIQKAASDEGVWPAGKKTIDDFLRRVVADLHRLPAVVVDYAEFDNYGSGDASYVDVFLTARDGSRRHHLPSGQIDVEGLQLCLCRLAQIAVLFTPDIRSTGPGPAGSYVYPQLARLTTVPVPGWEQACRQITQVLDRHGIALLEPAGLDRLIDRSINVETFFGDPPYTIFDAWFHWLD